MYHLQLTLETPAANIALDEQLLAAAEDAQLPGEVLRLWEPAAPFVVQGRSSPDGEVNAAACRAEGIPILRRASGGATVVAGPGCLMYALVLDLTRRPELRAIDRAHQHVIGTLAAALRPLAAAVGCAGTSDLVLAPPAGSPRKFSGNSLRVRRNHLLYHGTILYDFPLADIGRWLGRPQRQPSYRQGRDHGEFVTNLPAARPAIEGALIAAWDAATPLPSWPVAATPHPPAPSQLP
ncbi:MAG TPA: lipoate--protein ligase family protein [Lacipirellulaceae bacterium]|nr:lipoate--protein ligase family protein [Lacipirellulaceae bacterium]